MGNMINRVLRLILFLFVIGAETLHASTPLDIVSSFGKTLSKWCQTDDINCRKSLEKMCSGVKKCRVEDKVLADYLFKKGQSDHETFCLDSYLNMFQDVMEDGVTFNMFNIKVVSQDKYPDGQVLTFLTSDIKITGILNYEVKNLFLVRDEKISGIYHYSAARSFSHLNGSLLKFLQSGDYYFLGSKIINGFINLNKGNKDIQEGMIDVKGNIVIPFKWRTILYDGGAFAIGRGDYESSCVYDLRQGGKETPFNGNDKILVGDKSSIAKLVQVMSTKFSEGYTYVYNKEGKCGYLHESDLNYSNISYEFDFGGMFSEGYAFVTKNGTRYIVDKNMCLVMKDNSEYELCSTPHEGLITIRNKSNGKYGIINLRKKLVVPFIYDYIDYFSNGLCMVRRTRYDENEKIDEVAYIDKSGKIVIPFGFFEDSALTMPFKEGYLRAWKYVTEDFYEGGTVKKKKEKRCTLVGTDGKPLTGFDWKYTEVRRFSDGLARFKYNGKYGFMNLKGEIVILPTFSNVSDFKNGYACVEEVIDGKRRYGCINTDGILVVPYIYEHHFSFDNGLAIVSKDGKIGLIDVYGNSSF